MGLLGCVVVYRREEGKKLKRGAAIIEYAIAPGGLWCTIKEVKIYTTHRPRQHKNKLIIHQTFATIAGTNSVTTCP